MNVFDEVEKAFLNRLLNIPGSVTPQSGVKETAVPE